MSDKESISELENQIDTMNKTLKTSSRPAEEKAQLKQQISEYQARLDELRGTAKK
jgi:cell shape-determining protein MreC